jgi:soluble lytic murein transglycosylase-like protein
MYNQYDQIVQAAAVNYNVEVPLIKAVIMTESSFNPNAYRAEPAINDGSYGLMQVLFRTAVGLGFPNDPAQHERLFDPQVNIDLGTKFLAQLQSRYSQPDEIYAAYNAGVARRNAAGQFVNSKGDTAVQARVDRFMGIYTKFLSEWREAGEVIATDEAVQKGSVETGGVGLLLLVAVAGYLVWMNF